MAPMDPCQKYELKATALVYRSIRWIRWGDFAQARQILRGLLAEFRGAVPPAHASIIAAVTARLNFRHAQSAVVQLQGLLLQLHQMQTKGA